MPCYDPRSHPDYAKEQAVNQALKEFSHNSPLAQMVCTLMKKLTEFDLLEEFERVQIIEPGLQQWWADHQQRDKEKECQPKP